jgi:methyl-accepting chemotaxis protein
VDLSSLLLAPIRVPQRIVQGLDDLATLAERARRDPDPVEEVRDRIDALLAEIGTLNRLAATELIPVARDVVAVGQDIVDGGAELTEVAKQLRDTSREIVLGGEELTLVARLLHRDTRELIEGGERLTLVSEELEDQLETVADTVEPLQGAAERVGRVTKRLSRSSA